MRTLLRSVVLPWLALTTAGCGDDASPIAPNASAPVVLAVGGPACLAITSLMPPVNADGSSVFKLTRTIPVKIRVLDCVTQQANNDLQPQITLARVGADGDEAVNELESSSAADEGTMMRGAGNGQYIYNLSTKNSQFDAGRDLLPGVYELTISSPAAFADIVVQFALRG